MKVFRKRGMTVLFVFALVMSFLSACTQTAETPAASESGTQPAAVPSPQEEAPVATGEGAEQPAETTDSNFNKTGLPIVNEPETLSVLALQTYPEVTGENAAVNNEIEAATNVHIEWELVPVTSWPEKKGLMLSSATLPDIMMSDGIFTDQEMLQMAESERIIPLDGLLAEYGEYFNRIAENEPDFVPGITATDGHIYAFPRYIGVGDGTAKCILDTDRVMYINRTWLDKLGLESPKTTDELEQVLLEFKTEDPNGNGISDEIPMTAVTPWFYDDWFGAFGIVPHNNESKYLQIGLEDGKVIYGAVQPEYKDAINYFSRLWSQGLLDPETFTQDVTMFNAKLKSPTRIVGVFQAWRGTAWRLSNEDVEYEVLPPLTGPNGDNEYPKMYNGIQNRCSLVITSSCEKPELAIRWADYLLEPDNGYQFWTRTKIGYHIEKHEDGPFTMLRNIDVNEFEYMSIGYGITCVDGVNEKRKPVNPDPLDVDNEKGAADAIYEPHYPVEHYPNVFLSVEESVEIAELSVDLNSYLSQMYAKWITSGGADDEWDDYLAQMEALGVNDLVAQYQSAYDRYIASLN